MSNIVTQPTAYVRYVQRGTEKVLQQQHLIVEGEEQKYEWIDVPTLAGLVEPAALTADEQHAVEESEAETL
jgi:hypothetical protein